MNDRLFSIDPSSTKSGWAVFSLACELLEAGVVTPDKQAAEPEFRINRMCQDLWTLLDEHLPKIIILEWTTGKVARRIRGYSHGSGLPTYGCAVGGIWREVVNWRRSLSPDERIQVKIVLIRENTWTGQQPKQNRLAAVAAQYPRYRQDLDKGGDAGDAIAMADWWFHEQKVRQCEQLQR